MINVAYFKKKNNKFKKLNSKEEKSLAIVISTSQNKIDLKWLEDSKFEDIVRKKGNIEKNIPLKYVYLSKNTK